MDLLFIVASAGLLSWKDAGCWAGFTVSGLQDGSTFAFEKWIGHFSRGKIIISKFCYLPQIFEFVFFLNEKSPQSPVFGALLLLCFSRGTPSARGWVWDSELLPSHVPDPQSGALLQFTPTPTYTFHAQAMGQNQTLNIFFSRCTER